MDQSRLHGVKNLGLTAHNVSKVTPGLCLSAKLSLILFSRSASNARDGEVGSFATGKRALELAADSASALEGVGQPIQKPLHS